MCAPHSRCGERQASRGVAGIALGGRIAPGEGSPSRRITIVAFDSLSRAQQMVGQPLRAARSQARQYAKIRSYFI